MTIQPMQEPVCTEPGCGQIADGWNHSERNPRVHFFNRGTPLLDSARLPVPPEPTKPEPKPKRKADLRRCVRCGKVRHFHRGMIDHKFEAVGVPPSGFDSQWTGITTPTVAQIVDATERALRGMVIAPRLRCSEIRVTPQYAVDDDSTLLSATVNVSLSLIFPREEL